MLKFFLTVVLIVSLLLAGAVALATPPLPPCPQADLSGRPLTGEEPLATGQVRCMYGYKHFGGDCAGISGDGRVIYHEAERLNGRVACVYGVPIR